MFLLNLYQKKIWRIPAFAFLLVISALFIWSIFCPQAYAQEGTALYIKNIIGMQDSPEDNQKRSIETGAAAQYLVGGFEVKEAKIDTIALVREINDLVSVAGKYYKARPDYKGTFVASFVFYPGYKTAYQAPITSDMSETAKRKIEQLNSVIAKETQCSPEGFCSYLAFMGAEFTNPNNTAQKLDPKEFVDFLAKNAATNLEPTFHNNPQYKKPILFVFYMGTNGYLTQTSFVKEDLLRKNLIKKD